MDLHENGESNTVTATFELPGLKKEDVHIDVHNGHLSVSGESSESTEKNEEGYAIRERRFGKFARTLKLPQGVKVRSFARTRIYNGEADDFCAQDEEIKANMENGLLTVTFPRSAPEAAPKKIAIS
jgi:HSP20 family protein